MKPKSEVTEPHAVDREAPRSHSAPSCAQFPRGLVDGLTETWDQDYVGADLAKEFMKEKGYNKTVLIGVTDTFLPLDYPYVSSDYFTTAQPDYFVEPLENCENHGNCVANLIAHPRVGHSDVTKIATNTTINLSELMQLDRAIEVLKEENMEPWLVNNSWGAIYRFDAGTWSAQYSSIEEPDTDIVEKTDVDWAIRHYYSQLHRQGIIPVISAGNAYPSPVNLEGIDENKVIYTGNMGWFGYPDFSSQEGRANVVMAPGEKSTSWGYDLEEFGGTSAAAPMNTAAIANVLSIFGEQVDIESVKLLLRKVSTVTVSSFEKPKKNGEGLLNSFGLVVVADGIRIHCLKNRGRGYNHCLRRSIRQMDFKKILSKYRQSRVSVKRQGSFCAGVVPDRNGTTCEDLAETVDGLRKAALLDQGDYRSRSELSCFYKKMGLAKMAMFYDLQSKIRNPSSDLYRNIRRAPIKSRKSLFQLLPVDIQNAYYSEAGYPEGAIKIAEDFERRYRKGKVSQREGRSFFQQNAHYLKAILASGSDDLSPLRSSIFASAVDFERVDIVESLIRGPFGDTFFMDLARKMPTSPQIAKLIFSSESQRAKEAIDEVAFSIRDVDSPVMERLLSQHWRKISPELLIYLGKKLLRRGDSKGEAMIRVYGAVDSNAAVGAYYTLRKANRLDLSTDYVLLNKMNVEHRSVILKSLDDEKFRELFDTNQEHLLNAVVNELHEQDIKKIQICSRSVVVSVAAICREKISNYEKRRRQKPKLVSPKDLLIRFKTDDE